MQHKIRINDLARELEVKSRAILDVLPKVGVTEKKTHSSSIEEDEAERVKKYFAEHEPSSSRGSRAPAAAADEFKPKIDLSHISKPGDVLKAITQRAAQPVTPSRPVTPSVQAAAPSIARSSVAPPLAVSPKPAPASVHPVAAASTAPAAPPEPPKPAPRFITPQSVARPPAAIVIPPKPPAAPAAPQAHTPSVSEAAKPSEAIIENQVAVMEEPEAMLPGAGIEITAEETVPAEQEIAASPTTSATRLAPPPPRPAPPVAPPSGGVRPTPPGVLARTGQPQQPAASAATPAHPPRRLIVPQTGPRPVYHAPVRPPSATPPRAVMPERGKP
ncbi:MAG: translation initiation factor IF-2 N-terminal domain-containing protein, partial [Candidatus Korobacteraceae bacterium]